MDNLSDSFDALQQAAASSQTPAPGAAPTLADSMSSLLTTVKQVEPEVKKQIFEKRQERLKQPITPVGGQAATAAAMGTAAGFYKGLLSPVSAFLPDSLNDTLDAWEEDSIRKLQGMQAKSQYKSVYQANPKISSFLAGAPSGAGELAGSLPSFAVGYGAAREAFAVPKAISFTSEAARSLLAGATTGGVLSAAAKLDPGESRWAKIATDSIAMGSFEMLGIPAMAKAWKEETPALVEQVIKQSAPKIEGVFPGTHPTLDKTVDANLTALRAGIPVANETIDTVLNAAKDNPEIAKSPIAIQAAKQKSAKQAIQAPKVTIDPVLGTDGNSPTRITITIDGSPVASKDIYRDATNPQHFSNEVNAFKDSVKQLAGSEQNVAVSEIISGHPEDAAEVVNALQGKTVKAPNPDRKKRKVPGAAPASSVAENGDVPQPGTVVNIIEEDKPVVKGKVVEPIPDKYFYQADLKKFEGDIKGVVNKDLRDKYESWKTLSSKGSWTIEEGDQLSPSYSAVRDHPALPGDLRDRIAQEENRIETTSPFKPGDSVRLKSEVEAEKQQAKQAAAIEVKNKRKGFQAIAGGKISETRANELLDKLGGQGVDLDTAPPMPAKLTKEQKADRFARSKEPSTVSVEMDDKTIRQVPLAQLQVPLEVGVKQEPTVLKPHPDGSDRHGIIHLDTGEVSYEGIGAPQDPAQSHFRNEMFSSTDPNMQWGRDPRLFIHNDGITISVPKLNGEQAELVTQKSAAKVLIKQGVDPNTAVKATIASTGHTAETAGGSMSLRELSDIDLPLANLRQLQDAAADRGLTASAWGDKVTLKSKSGYSKTFANSLEAHAAVLRMPNPEVDNKVEAALEQQWKMGSERAYDPDVDVTHFLPLDVQEKGIGELVQGKRPLVPVYTKDPKSLTDTVRKLEQGLGMPENTFKVLLLPAMDNTGRKAAVLYNSDAIAVSAAKNRDALNYLNVYAKDPAGILKQLSEKGQGHGIYVLSGRDAESAALYAKWRDGGNKEFWEKGRVEVDSLGPYRRYSKDAKQVIHYPGAGDEKYFPQDLADSFQPPEGVHFAGDSAAKPRMAEEMAPYEPDLSFGEKPAKYDSKNLPPGEFHDTSGPMAKVFGLRFRPIMELSKDLQARTGVPFYEWYRGIEVGRNKVEQVANPILAGVKDLAKGLTRDEREQVQRLFESRITDKEGVAAFEAKLPQRVRDTATHLEKMYSDFFQKEGFSQDDIQAFFSVFPNVRKADGDYRYAVKGMSGVPKIGQLLSKDLQNGAINIDARELDFQRIANRIVRSTATERYLQPSWERVSTELEAYSQAKRIPNDYSDIFRKYMQEVLHIPDALHQSLSRGVKQVFAKMGGRMSDIEAQDSVSMLIQMNYFSNLGWQPGQVLRNAMQTLQTSLPVIGTKDTLAGWRFGIRWWKDPKLQEQMVKRGIIQPDAIYAPLQEITRLTERGGGKVDKALDVFFNQGTRWHTNTYDFNRVVAYWGQYSRAKRVGQEFLDKKIDWATFVEKSKLDMRDNANGPFIQEVKKAMEAKDLEKAASRMGEEFAKSTQFVYSRGNSPYVMQSTLGRFLLQYGTWPAWYAENMRNLVMRGSYKNRALSMTRWLGVQSAMFGTANALFGVDMARWTFFSPLGYTGGPFAQIAMQGAQTWKSAVDPSSDDPIARIAKARLASGIVKQVTPLPLGAMTNLFKGVKDLNEGNWQQAMRQLLGLPPAKGPILP